MPRETELSLPTMCSTCISGLDKAPTPGEKVISLSLWNHPETHLSLAPCMGQSIGSHRGHGSSRTGSGTHTKGSAVLRYTEVEAGHCGGFCEPHPPYDLVREQGQSCRLRLAVGVSGSCMLRSPSCVPQCSQDQSYPSPANREPFQSFPPTAGGVLLDSLGKTLLSMVLTSPAPAQQGESKLWFFWAWDGGGQLVCGCWKLTWKS